MSLKFPPLLCIVIAALMFSCKKADLTKPLTVVDTELHTPEGYNPNLYYNKKDLVMSAGSIFNLIVNATNSAELTLVGNFYNVAVPGFNSIYSPGIARYNVSSGALTKYPISLNSNYSNVYSFINGLNGKDYLGGLMVETSGGVYVYLGVKPASAAYFSSSAANVNGSIYSMIERSGKIYFTGAFTYTVPYSGYSSPVLSYDMNTNVVTNFGSPMTNPSANNKCLELHNNKMYVAGGYGYVNCSSGGPWTIAGGGFNDFVEDLLVHENKLYAAGQMTGYYSTSGSLNYVNFFNENTQLWEKAGVNNLPGPVKDIESYNSELYACGVGFIYKLDKNDNKWKSVISPSVSIYEVKKIKFSQGKLFAVEYNSFTGYFTLVQVD